MAIAMGMSTMVRVSNRPQLMERVLLVVAERRRRYPPCLACHGGPLRRQPPDAFDEPVEERRDVGLDRDIEIFAACP